MHSVEICNIIVGLVQLSKPNVLNIISYSVLCCISQVLGCDLYSLLTVCLPHFPVMIKQYSLYCFFVNFMTFLGEFFFIIYYYYYYSTAAATTTTTTTSITTAAAALLF